VAPWAQRLADVLDAQLISTIVGHKKWEEEYTQLDALIKAGDEEKQPEGENEGEETRNKEADQQKLSELHERIKQSIRNIVRYCHEHKPKFEQLKEIIGHKRNTKIQEFFLMFASQFDIFRQKMTTSKEEEDSKAEQLKQLQDRVPSSFSHSTRRSASSSARKKNASMSSAITRPAKPTSCKKPSANSKSCEYVIYADILQKEIKSVKDSKEQELIAIKKDSEQLIKEHDEEHKRTLEKLESERKKKTDELTSLMMLNKTEEEKNRQLLNTQIRTQFNDKIIDYDGTMDAKTKEKEEQKVSCSSTVRNS
jgi:hypothetical protein